MEFKYLSYPRPNFRRNYISLNGEWDFYFEVGDVGERLPRYIEFPLNEAKKIQVPYCYQCELSGINIQKKYETVWYHKLIDVKLEKNQRAIIHFGAVDYWSKLYVNKQYVGEHKGGFTEFSFDITDYIVDGKADIVLFVNDTYSLSQPRGKQKWRDEPFGCWYQEVTGIWKSVWIEIVNDVYISSFKMTPLKGNIVNLEVSLNKKFNGVIYANFFKKDEFVKDFSLTIDNKDYVSCLLKFEDLKKWDVDNPTLYDVTINLKDNIFNTYDTVGTYFGYRLVDSGDSKFLINNKETFLRMVLEQGYYIKGIYTFKNEQEIIDEVKLIKDLGFNGLRMHQKVEDDRFYYLCDVLGLYVWSEMPSCYEFDNEMINNSKREWKEVLKQHYNFPSIIVWTPVNECWGVPGIRTEVAQQEYTDEMYQITKEFDKTRLVISDDGWLHTTTDIVTLHNYIQDPNRFKYYVDNAVDIVENNKRLDDMNVFLPFANGYKYNNQPIMYTEFCGIGFNIQDTTNGWGYGTSVESTKAFLDRYKGIIDAANQPNIISGWCVTQISDVYQEVNGLVTMDRKPKADIKILNKINSYK